MTINESRLGEIVVIAPVGRLTVETESEFSGVVKRTLAAGNELLVLDLAEVPYIDSCGLGAIAQAYVGACRRGGTMKLANVGGRTWRLLRITQLLSVFDVYGSVNAAARSYGPELCEPAFGEMLSGKYQVPSKEEDSKLASHF
jgi:anti-sigma B factor antagonist